LLILNVQANVCSIHDLTPFSMENGVVVFSGANSFHPASIFWGNEFGGVFLEPGQVGQVGSFQGLVGGDPVSEARPEFGNGWSELCKLELVNMGFGSGGLMSGSTTEFEMNCAISRTSSCPLTLTPATSEAKVKVSALAKKMSYAVGRERA
jgi:hypothetical protein